MPTSTRIVKKGELLAEIDPPLLQVQVDVQNANVERQRADIANQKVQLEDQKKQFERTKSLFEKGLQNQQQFEAAELAIKTREAQILSAEKAARPGADANLSSAKLNVSYTKIYAPADGVVIERRVDRGQTVQASMTAPSVLRAGDATDGAEADRARRRSGNRPHPARAWKCASRSMRTAAANSRAPSTRCV